MEANGNKSNSVVVDLRKMTERSQWMLRYIVQKGQQLSAVNQYRPSNFVYPSDKLKNSA